MPMARVVVEAQAARKDHVSTTQEFIFEPCHLGRRELELGQFIHAVVNNQSVPVSRAA